ncbi:MAG: replicative DNA helicase [Bacteroidia bacterium]|jgi:replicative DNA helicase|nr:replicative DNA helicase [Bacteroidia bacterium]
MAENISNKRKTTRNIDLKNILETGKVPPQAVDLEEAVLGALMLDKNAITVVADVLKPESFYKDAHITIFQSIKDLFSRAEPIDILTVTADLRKKGQLDIVGGAYYITSLTNRVASAANIEYHARIIAQKFIQRELIRISTEIQQESFEESSDAFELLDSAERKLFEVSQGNIKRDYKQMNYVIKEAIREIEALKGKEGGLTGIPSGFSRLDRITSGFQKSDLIILAARPGMGKTAMVLSIARNASLNSDTPRAIAIFSLEMSSRQLVTRMISGEAEITGEKLKKGTLAEHEWQQLNTKIARLNEAPIFIDDTPALSIFELRSKCRRLKEQHNIEMIIIDYLQLMRGDDANNKNGNREQEVSYISRSLKALAKELDVPVIALAQLSRASEKRGVSSIPMLSDLRESGSIEQDADMVMFIYRPEYYKINEFEDGSSTHGIAELHIAKHRNGALDNVRVRFVHEFTKFQDLTEFEYQSDTSILTDNPGTITFSSKLNDMNHDDDDVFQAPF